MDRLHKLGPFWERLNAPITAWAVANLVALATPLSLTGQLAKIVSTAALVFWAFLELFAGSGPFRRALGGVVLLTLLLSLGRMILLWQ